jgi:hypothetical protein
MLDLPAGVPRNNLAGFVVVASAGGATQPLAYKTEPGSLVSLAHPSTSSSEELTEALFTIVPRT